MTTEPRPWQPGDPVYTDQPAELTCSCGVRVLWRPDTPLDCPECGRLLLVAAPAGTGSPTPADAPDLDAIRTRSARASGAAGWLDSPPDRADEPHLETHAHEVIAESAADVPVLLAELSQVQKERDAARESLKVVSSLHADSGLVIALAGERDEARSALAALREQHDRDMESWQQDVETLDELQKAITRATANDGSESDAEAIERIGNEARHHIDRVIDLEDALAALRAEVGKIADDVASGIESIKRLERLGDDDPPTWQEHIRTRTVLLGRLRALVTDQSPAAPREPEGRSPKVALRALQDLREGLALRGIDPPHWRGAVRAALAEIDRLRAGLSPTSDTPTDSGGS